MSRETTAETIIAEVLALRDRVRETLAQTSGPAPLFCTFWDFDGTIIKGDISEGLADVYRGLVQLGCEAGLAPDFPGTDGFERFWEEYRRLEREESKWAAYTFLPRIFAGASVEELSGLARAHLDETLSTYLFRGAVETIRRLRESDIHVTVISASPDVFVAETADLFDLDPAFVSGIEIAAGPDGRLTDELVEPVNFADGKTRRLELYMEEMQRRHPGREVVPLAGFGDSPATDGEFLSWLSGRTIPGGTSLAYMVNPPDDLAAEYRARFRPLRFETIVGGEE